MALAGLGPGDVLVLRALGLGDALTGVAALRGVRRAWPGRRVVLAGPEGIGGWFVRLGLVDAVVPTAGLDEPLAVGGAGGHVAVNLHGRGPQSHRLLAATMPSQLVAFACAEAGHPASVADVAPEFRDGEHEVARWCRLLAAAGGDCGPEDLRLPVEPAEGVADAVLLHPGAASGSRRWPAERWHELARRLTAAGHRVLVTGSPAEAGLCAEVAGDVATSVAGEHDVPGLASLVAGARLLVCGDTGVAHVATGVGTPSVLLFGPTPPAAWGPAVDTERHVVLWHGDGTGDPHAAELDPALAAITVDEVEAAVSGLLALQPAR
ncbi:glycosyltransferase family 9 protein [Georgenia phoenicis]|uniref:glycosyltransferase family 9 protein n=1 Tax=unclassified Georgenia TaxID=2626815 RepID=UPI0039AF8647